MAVEDDHVIPESGAVFTFGKSKFADNIPSRFWIRNDRIQQIACGDEHTAIVVESGRLFVFGNNSWGQLGQSFPKGSDKPTCVKALKHEKLKAVGCGRAHTLVAAVSGNLYGFGANNEGQLGVGDTSEHVEPTLVKDFQADVKKIDAGMDHSVVLTEKGQLFIFGGGMKGLLGFPDTNTSLIPRELVLGNPVSSVSCGYYHTAIVTEDGMLFTFGEREHGKLGFPDDPDGDGYVTTPQCVTRIPEFVTKVACGGSHTIVLTETGSVYAFGDGSSGQLGLGTSNLQTSIPLKISAFANLKMVHIVCGENHTAAISEKGSLYVFGDGRHGKLALGNENFSNQFWPVKVQRFKEFTVKKVSCGGCHSMVLAVPNSEPELFSDEEITSYQLMRSLTIHPNIQDTSLTARERRHRKHLSSNSPEPQDSPDVLKVIDISSHENENISRNENDCSQNIEHEEQPALSNTTDDSKGEARNHLESLVPSYLELLHSTENDMEESKDVAEDDNDDDEEEEDDSNDDDDSESEVNDTEISELNKTQVLITTSTNKMLKQSDTSSDTEDDYQKTQVINIAAENGMNGNYVEDTEDSKTTTDISTEGMSSDETNKSTDDLESPQQTRRKRYPPKMLSLEPVKEESNSTLVTSEKQDNVSGKPPIPTKKPENFPENNVERNHSTIQNENDLISAKDLPVENNSKRKSSVSSVKATFCGFPVKSTKLNKYPVSESESNDNMSESRRTQSKACILL